MLTAVCFVVCIKLRLSQLWLSLLLLHPFNERYAWGKISALVNQLRADVIEIRRKV